jgi:P27 family predicted phage terminase small subunit
MRGAKPTPTKLKILRGNPGRRPLNDQEPSPEIKIPDAPEHLTPTARIEWERISKVLFNLGLLSEIDRTALAGYCQLYGRWADAEEAIKKSGLIIKTTNGNVIQSPMVGIANRSLELMKQYLVEFGMTPSSRTRVKVQDKPKKSEWDDI